MLIKVTDSYNSYTKDIGRQLCLLISPIKIMQYTSNQFSNYLFLVKINNLLFYLFVDLVRIVISL